MNSFRKFKIAFISILLPAMLLLAGNAVFNWHVHKCDNGKMIVHAHPYQKSSSQNGTNHSHSCSDCLSLQQITSFLFVLTTTLVLILHCNDFVDITKTYHYHVKQNLLSCLLPNRAPPALS